MSKDKQNNNEKEIMRNAKMEIIYRITDEDGTVVERVANVNVPGKSDMDFSTIESVKYSFSAYEEAVLEADRKLREEIANDHMKEASKKDLQDGVKERLREIECETGRVKVYLYGVEFSSLRPKERIWVSSLSERVLELASDVSFSQATKYVNDFFRRDKSNSLCYKTVEEFVERTGRRIGESYKAASDAFLAEANIDTADGVITKESAIAEGARNPKLPEVADSERVRETAERYNHGRDERESVDTDNMSIPPEDPDSDCVYVYVDGVLVKHQKECRKPGSKRSSKFIENNVACIQYGDRKYNITDTDMREVFRRIMTVLLACDLLVNRRLIFITDGANDIKDCIQEFFGFRQYTLILDWYHLGKMRQGGEAGEGANHQNATEHTMGGQCEGRTGFHRCYRPKAHQVTRCHQRPCRIYHTKAGEHTMLCA